MESLSAPVGAQAGGVANYTNYANYANHGNYTNYTNYADYTYYAIMLTAMDYILYNYPLTYAKACDILIVEGHSSGSRINF